MSARMVIGLGSNLGSRESLLRAAVDLLEATPGCTITALSSLFETEPVGLPGPLFLNAAVSLQTELAPEDLLQRLQAIESSLARVRRARWESRTIDLDILWSEQGRISTPTLDVPHPRLQERAFALAPLLEVAPELAERYASYLREGGGAPPRCGSLGVPAPELTATRAADGRSYLQVGNRADALANLATLLATVTRDAVSGFPLQTFPVGCRCEPGQEPEAFARAVVKLTGSGFNPCRVVVCDLAPGKVEGRLVGRPGNPATTIPELRVTEKDRAIELCVYLGTGRLDVITFSYGIGEG